MEPEELKNLVKKNDNNSRRLLFEAYYKKTYAVAYNILRSRENAEDIAQDAFIKAFQNIGQLQDGAKFGAWLAVIASNLARNYLKREKRIYYTDQEVVMEQGSEVNYTEESALRGLEVEQVRKAIRALPPEHYQVVVLQYYYELKVEEIADMLKLRTGTVKSRLSRARQRLAEYLELKEGSACLIDKGGEGE